MVTCSQRSGDRDRPCSSRCSPRWSRHRRPRRPCRRARGRPGVRAHRGRGRGSDGPRRRRHRSGPADLVTVTRADPRVRRSRHWSRSPSSGSRPYAALVVTRGRRPRARRRRRPGGSTAPARCRRSGRGSTARPTRSCILVLSVYVASSWVGWWVLAIGVARYALRRGRVVAAVAAPGSSPFRYWRKVVTAVQGIVLTVRGSRPGDRRGTDVRRAGASRSPC